MLRLLKSGLSNHQIIYFTGVADAAPFFIYMIECFMLKRYCVEINVNGLI